MSGKTLMEQVRDLAETKQHRVAANLVNGSVDLDDRAARAILAHLGRCQDRPDAQEIRARQAARQEPATARPRPRDVPPSLSNFKGKVPAGYYATESRTGSNDLDFWRVKIGTRGQWEGFSFAWRVLGGGGGDGMRTEHLPGMQQRLALQAISDTGIDEAKMLFARNIGRCSECGLPLTDDISRAAGKGPVCRTKKG